VQNVNSTSNNSVSSLASGENNRAVSRQKAVLKAKNCFEITSNKTAKIMAEFLGIGVSSLTFPL